jgi:hypothetical protein
VLDEREERTKERFVYMLGIVERIVRHSLIVFLGFFLLTWRITSAIGRGQSSGVTRACYPRS